ncbi:hypothetical protein TNCV_3133501 [Trichonephila clavipes]|nr:hypothetical protein TNCV_3133501 [Trichonephila clavipes]
MDIRQLGVRIMIHVDSTLSMSEMRKPHVPTLRAPIQCHLLLPTHAFLFPPMAPRDVLYLLSKFVHGIQGHPVILLLMKILIV